MVEVQDLPAVRHASRGRRLKSKSSRYSGLFIPDRSHFYPTNLCESGKADKVDQPQTILVEVEFSNSFAYFDDQENIYFHLINETLVERN